MPLRFLICAAVLSALVGCGGDGSQGLRVLGSAEVELADGTKTGFEFLTTTRLADSGSTSGLVEGQCLIIPETETLDLSLSRSPTDGLHAFELHRTADSIVVEADVGGEQLMADGITCAGIATYDDGRDRRAGVTLDCPFGDQILRVDLQFAGCEVR